MLNKHEVGFAEVGYAALDAALCLGTTDNVIVNVEDVLDTDYDDPPTEGEQAIIDICKAAKAQGVGDVIIYHQ